MYPLCGNKLVEWQHCVENPKKLELESSWNCPLECGAVFCTLNPVLTGCPKALGDGRYRWRHDNVLTVIAKWVQQQRIKANEDQAPPCKAAFHPAVCKGNEEETGFPTRRGGNQPPPGHGCSIQEYQDNPTDRAYCAVGGEASYASWTEGTCSIRWQ